MNQTSISVAIFGVASIILATVMSVQPVLASSGASGFAPGQVKSTESDSQSASAFAPGALEREVQGKLPGGGCIASINSPGNLFRQEPTTTDINP